MIIRVGVKRPPLYAKYEGLILFILKKEPSALLRQGF